MDLEGIAFAFIVHKLQPANESFGMEWPLIEINLVPLLTGGYSVVNLQQMYMVICRPNTERNCFVALPESTL